MLCVHQKLHSCTWIDSEGTSTWYLGSIGANIVLQSAVRISHYVLHNMIYSTILHLHFYIFYMYNDYNVKHLMLYVHSAAIFWYIWLFQEFCCQEKMTDSQLSQLMEKMSLDSFSRREYRVTGWQWLMGRNDLSLMICCAHALWWNIIGFYIHAI